MKTYYAYIMVNTSRTIYIGVTNDLERRVWQHKNKSVSGFTAKHGLTNLVYYEEFTNIHDALVREKQLKGWRRSKKVALVNESNPAWRDLSTEWSAGPLDQTTF